MHELTRRRIVDALTEAEGLPMDVLLQLRAALLRRGIDHACGGCPSI